MKIFGGSPHEASVATQREIAAEVSVDVATVNRAVAKRNSSEMQHAENPEPATQELTEQQERPKSRGDCLTKVLSQSQIT